ncbi:MAG: transposase family protein [Pseudonocardia sp.]|uniref:IS110 family transposase n=1 Tax=Pseudonocardia sp. TaxID=60912 RepID=UPI003451805D|nr:transposase family protein [Pseudonocardia sp.]
MDRRRGGPRAVVAGHDPEAGQPSGHRGLFRFATREPGAVWVIEGAGGLGAPLASRLSAGGIDAVDVSAELAARVRVFSTGHGRKNDDADAISVAVAALSAAGLRTIAVDEAVTALRALVEHRDDVVTTRTQTVNRLHVLLTQLLPGGAPRRLSADAAAPLLRTVRARRIGPRTLRGGDPVPVGAPTARYARGGVPGGPYRRQVAACRPDAGPGVATAHEPGRPCRCSLPFRPGELANARGPASPAHRAPGVASRIAQAELTGRRKIERDLHDGAQQTLWAARMSLGEARQKTAPGTAAYEAIRQAQSDLGAATDELRRLARGISPPILTQSGLRPALEGVIERLGVRVTGSVLSDRLEPAVENTAYFVACEAITNAVKHGASPS